MSLWRREAIMRFPELHREIADYAALRREFATNRVRIEKQQRAESHKQAPD